MYKRECIKYYKDGSILKLRLYHRKQKVMLFCGKTSPKESGNRELIRNSNFVFF